MSVQAMKAGAADFLPKPFAGKELWPVVERAIQEAAVSAPSVRNSACWRNGLEG